MHIGPRHRFTGVNIDITSTIVGFVRCLGAIGMIVKVWGGSNGANALSEMTMRPSHDGTQSAGGGIFVNAIGEGLTNSVEALANPLYIPSNYVTAALITPWPTVAARIEATMLVAISNGCTVDVWPVYDELPAFASTLPT